MKYISTRGKAPELGFENVLLSGLASDGGLYIPKNWPAIKYQDLPDGPYYENAAFVIHPFVEDFLDYEQLKSLQRKLMLISHKMMQLLLKKLKKEIFF